MIRLIERATYITTYTTKLLKINKNKLIIKSLQIIKLEKEYFCSININDYEEINKEQLHLYPNDNCIQLVNLYLIKKRNRTS